MDQPQRQSRRAFLSQDGRITAIHAADAAPITGVSRHQAQGQLRLPAFRDMHIHLDKTFYSGPHAAPLSSGGVWSPARSAKPDAGPLMPS